MHCISSHICVINDQVPSRADTKEEPAKGYVAMNCATNVILFNNQLHAGSMENYMKVMIRLTEQTKFGCTLIAPWLMDLLWNC